MATELKKVDLNLTTAVGKLPKIENPLPQVSQAAQKATAPVTNLTTQMNKKTLYAISFIVILLGIASGYGLNLYARSQTAKVGGQQGGVVVSSVKVGDIVGSDDERAFKDSAEGVIEKGGLEGEGSHKLLRPGGPSQTVYLTSSIIDLDEFVGHKIKVWGETFAAQKAGWLMDVGRIQVVELNAGTPE